jgi:hypothetical protein
MTNHEPAFWHVESRDPSDPDSRGCLRQELRHLLPELASGDERAAEPCASAPAAKLRLYDAVARALGLLSERTPCFIVLDYLQQADASLELLHYLLRAAVTFSTRAGLGACAAQV